MRSELLSLLSWTSLLISTPALADSGLLKPRADGVKPIGIQLDQVPQIDAQLEPGAEYASYSAIIEYDPDIIRPMCGLSDEELHNLVWHAYNEMEQVRRLHQAKAGNAMGALVHGQRIYFASAISSNWPDDKIAMVGQNFDDDTNVSWYMQLCLLDSSETVSIHKSGGKCAEPNVIRLFHEAGNRGRPGENRFLVVEPTDARGGMSRVITPCQGVTKPKVKQGCETTFMREYRLNPVRKNVGKELDPTRQFEFTQVTNPRPAQ